MQYKNFYETIQEAWIRLRQTVVLYDGEPYYVGAITAHKNDGIFRMYLEPIGYSPASGLWSASVPDSRRPPWQNFHYEDHHTLGKLADDWLETTDGKESGILRKMMNSPAFNKFRPFPLGYYNARGNAIYSERHPTRKSEQGLTYKMLVETIPSIENGPMRNPNSPIITMQPFRDCILGRYPSAQECLKNLQNPGIQNRSVAFHRNFALLRGPIDTFYLSYKEDIVGILKEGDFSKLRLAPDKIHTMEAVQELNLFGSVSY